MHGNINYLLITLSMYVCVQKMGASGAADINSVLTLLSGCKTNFTGKQIGAIRQKTE